MNAYFAEMFPIPWHFVFAFLTYASVASFARWTHQQNSSLASWHTLLGTGSVFGLWLILRLMDELKDQDIDRELFPDRPLPSGRVSAADIKRTLVVAILLYLAAHLAGGPAFWSALFVLGYSVLMFKRFFADELLRKNLIITLVSHNPIVPWMLGHCFVIFAAEHGLALNRLRWDLIVPFVVMLWAPFLAWELARKIRAPEEETAYVTYSRLFGHVRAALLAAGIQIVALSIGLYFWSRFSLSWVYLGILTIACGSICAGYLRFLLHPSARTAKLKYYAAAFLLCMETAQFVEFGRLVAQAQD
jgi:4-hydroxybenzoate polyprenyltransferase